jgi:hypothetical protein
MGVLKWWAIKAASAVVRSGMKTASDAKLLRRYNMLQRVYNYASGYAERRKIILLQEELLHELRRRGVKTIGH